MDTRLTTSITPDVVPTEGSDTGFAPATANPAYAPTSDRPKWLLPLMIVSSASIVVILIVAAYTGWVRSRSKKKSDH
jgi:hypothetical protein